MTNPFIPFTVDPPSDFGMWRRCAIEFEESEAAAIGFAGEPREWHPKLAALQQKFSEIVSTAGEDFARRVLGAVSHRKLAVWNALLFAADRRGCETEFDLKSRILTLKHWGAVATIVVKKQAHPDAHELADSMVIQVAFPFQYGPRISDSRWGFVEARLSHVFLHFYESVMDQCTKTYEQRRQEWQDSENKWLEAREQAKLQRAENSGRRRAKREARASAQEQRPEGKLMRILDEIRASADVLPPVAEANARPAGAVIPSGDLAISSGAIATAASAPSDRSARLLELISESGDFHLSRQVSEYAGSLRPTTANGRAWVEWALSAAAALSPAAARIAQLDAGDASS
jgi:hypothetical protein